MIEFDTKDVEVFNDRLIIKIPNNTSLDTISKAKKDNKFIHVSLNIPRRQRSLSANAFCWKLCQMIAEELSKDGNIVRKEEVYRRSIKELFDPVIENISNENVEIFKTEWEKRGIGWMFEDLGESTLYGKTRMAFYKGSSSFDTAQMARLIDGLIQDAEALDITVQDYDDILMNWENDRKK